MTFARFQPIDSLLFRDGRPFHQDDPGLSQAATVFPPHPPTLVGALRFALWQSLGGGRWPKDRLGDGVNWQDDNTSLGELRAAGVMVLQDESARPSRLFPAPLSLLRRSDGSQQATTLLRPGEVMACDLGERTALPQPTDGGAGWKTCAENWLTTKGLTTLLSGAAPMAAALVARKSVWSLEPRIGIGRNPTTRTASEGQLYSAAHARLAADISLALRLEGYPKVDQPTHPRLVALGGEGRFASLSIEQPTGFTALPTAPNALTKSAPGKRAGLVVHLGPADLDAPAPGGQLPGVPGTVVCACLDRPLTIGGWDSATGCPLPLKPLVATGSVWFLEVPDSEQGQFLALHGRAIGRGTAWGFGEIAVGTYRPAERGQG